jgi:hypothetical protein
MENNKIHKKAKEALNSLDGIQKAEPSELFYERVLLRLENKEARVIRLTPRTVWQAAACIAILIMLNVLVCVHFSKNNNQRTQASRNPVTEEYFSYLRTAQF